MVRATDSTSATSADLTWERLREITGQEEATAALEAYLSRMTTPADLRSGGAAIKRLVGDLVPEAQEALRGRYMAMLAAIQHEVKAEALDGRRTTVVRARYVDTKVGPTFRLKGSYVHQDGEPREFECWMPGSSRGPVFRFFERRPHDAYPVDVCFRKEQHPRDADKEMWTVELLAPPAGSRSWTAAPF